MHTEYMVEYIKAELKKYTRTDTTSAMEYKATLLSLLMELNKEK